MSSLAKDLLWQGSSPSLLLLVLVQLLLQEGIMVLAVPVESPVLDVSSFGTTIWRINSEYGSRSNFMSSQNFDHFHPGF
jgi:hypothetical protein